MNNNLKTILWLIYLVVHSSNIGYCTLEDEPTPYRKLVENIKCDLNNSSLDYDEYSIATTWTDICVSGLDELNEIASLQNSIANLIRDPGYCFAIKTIAIENVLIPPSALHFIASLTSLEYLSLIGCQNSSEELIGLLVQLQSNKLKEINVSDTEIEKVGISGLRYLPKGLFLVVDYPCRVLDFRDSCDYSESPASFADISSLLASEHAGLVSDFSLDVDVPPTLEEVEEIVANELEADSVASPSDKIFRPRRPRGNLKKAGSAVLQYLQVLPSDIRQLNLEKNNLIGIEAEDITRFYRLESLSLSNSFGMSDTVLIQILNGLPDTFEKLYLLNFYLKDNSALAITVLRNLRLLNLNGCEQVSHDILAIMLSRLPDSMECLYLAHTQMSNIGARELARFRDLKGLNLNGCTNVNSKILSDVLSSMSHSLLVLHLRGVKITEEVIPGIRMLENIRALDISDNKNIDKYGVGIILNNLPDTVERLDVSGTYFSDMSIERILKLDLNFLNTTGCSLLSSKGVSRLLEKFPFALCDVIIETSDKSCGCVIL